MQPAKPAYPSLQPGYGMGAPQQPAAWNMPPAARQQPEQSPCLRTAVLVTGIIHIVMSIFPTNVLGIIAGCFQLTGASQVRGQCTGFSSQGRAKLSTFRNATALKSTQLSPSMTRKPCTYDKCQKLQKFCRIQLSMAPYLPTFYRRDLPKTVAAAWGKRATS